MMIDPTRLYDAFGFTPGVLCLRVVRYSDGSEEVLVNSETNMMHQPAPQESTPLGVVGYQLRATKNMGGGDYLQAGAILVLPCQPQEHREVFDFCKDFCENRIDELLQAYEAVNNPEEVPGGVNPITTHEAGHKG